MRYVTGTTRLSNKLKKMNKYEVLQEMDSFLFVFKTMRNAVRNRVRDEHNRIIHEVMADAIPDREPYYAYFCDVKTLTLMNIRVKYSEMTCDLLRHASGRCYFNTDEVINYLGEPFADALRDNYNTIVERIKQNE